MRCPHFQKVNFERIKEVNNDEATVEDQANQHIHYSLFSIESLSEEIYNIPEEGIEHVKSMKSNLFNHRNSLNSLDSKQDPIRESQKIKMPKQMNIKKMITSTEGHFSSPSINYIQEQNYKTGKYLPYPSEQQHEQDGQIPSQHEHSQSRKNPHILVSKTSMMTHQTFEIFNGIIFLAERQQTAFQCQLKDYIIKISRQDKIKYFIELQKVYISLQQLGNETGVKLQLKCKNKTDIIWIYFISAFQKEIFIQVYSNCVKKIKQTRKIKKLLEHDKQNYLSTNSYKNLQDEEQLSEILNQKNQLSEEEPIDSISSLSMNSYEGDSLVFETERMFFNQVRDNCNTFDILLFKNKSLMSKVQRIFTNSDYDHTAMLLKTANNELLMLEATSNSGVAIYTFSSLLKIDRDKYFSRIGLRKYTGEKNLAKIARLQNFIRKTVGKKYKFDPMYLIRSQANEQKQTFFCSELVAEALQDAGILSNEFPSFKYLPKHFAAQNLNCQVIDGKYSETIILE